MKARIAVGARDAEWAEGRLSELFGENVRKLRSAVEIDAVFELEGFTRSEALEVCEDTVDLETVGYGWFEEKDDLEERPDGWVELESVVEILRRRAESEGSSGRSALMAAADSLLKTYSK